jgi:hypothetical protein
MMATLPCQTLIEYVDFYTLYFTFNVVAISTNTGRIKAINRIGPHSKDVLSIIIGGMIGDIPKSVYFSTTSHV